MNLIISSLYTQPGVSFQISYKTFRFIEQILNREVMPQYNPPPLEKEWSLSLIISTNDKCVIAEAKGPERDKRNKCLTWGIWLPYLSIVKDINQNNQFISQFFEAAQIVFQFYGIRPEVVKNAMSVVEKEIIGKKEYEYSEVVPSIDLTKIKI